MAEVISSEVVTTLLEHHRRFLDFLTRRVGSRAAAEDLLQAAFVRGIERGGELRSGESADAERRGIERHTGEATLTSEMDEALEAAVCECVNDLIPTLKPEYADILRAVEMEGHGVPDVARQLAITPGNAAVRLHRARQALKARLEMSCGTCTEHGCLDCTCETKASL